METFDNRGPDKHKRVVPVMGTIIEYPRAGNDGGTPELLFRVSLYLLDPNRNASGPLPGGPVNLLAS